MTQLSIRVNLRQSMNMNIYTIGIHFYIMWHHDKHATTWYTVRVYYQLFNWLAISHDLHTGYIVAVFLVMFMYIRLDQNYTIFKVPSS